MQTTCKSYAELEKTVRVFAAGTFNILFVIGDAGLAKTTIVTRALPKARVIKGGSVTAFEMYRELWRHRDADFILDDTDELYRDRTLTQLLKALCETEASKVVRWTTASRLLEEEGIERQFVTRTRVAVLLNETGDVGKYLRPLEDRGLMVFFRPPVEEVLKVGRRFVKDREILKFVGDRRPYIDRLSLRALLIADEMKRAGLGWKEPLVESLGIRLVLLAKEINEDATLLGEVDRVAAWSERTGVRGRPGMNRTSFFTYTRRYRELEKSYGVRKTRGRSAAAI